VLGARRQEGVGLRRRVSPRNPFMRENVGLEQCSACVARASAKLVIYEISEALLHYNPMSSPVLPSLSLFINKHMLGVSLRSPARQMVALHSSLFIAE
jgi:hypothetical protein